MQNIFIELLPPWIETGLQPAFYDKESGTVLQQVSRMWAKMIQLGQAFNTFSEDTTTFVNQFVDDTNATVDEYIAKFVELHDYVEDYFANLDVQEEINNKLDAMAEAGTLQEIITSYIQSNVAWTFDTVADMKQATNLVNGSYARTLGFHSVNDGGGALYKITDTGTANEMDVIAVGSLYATLVNPKNVKQYGAYGDGANNDTDAVQRALSTNSVVYFNDGTYMCDSLTATNVTLKGNKVVIKARSALTTLLSVSDCAIEGISFDCDNKADNAIKITGLNITLKDSVLSKSLSWAVINQTRDANEKAYFENDELNACYAGVQLYGYPKESPDDYQGRVDFINCSSTNNTGYGTTGDNAAHIYFFAQVDYVYILGGNFTGNAERAVVNVYQVNHAIIDGGYYHDIRHGVTLGKITKNAVITNTVIENIQYDSGISIDLVTADRVYPEGHCIISNNIVKNAYRGMFIQGKNVIVNNNYFYGGTYSTVTSGYIRCNAEDDNTADSHIIIDNIYMYNFPNLGQFISTGTAVATIGDHIYVDGSPSYNSIVATNQEVLGSRITKVSDTLYVNPFIDTIVADTATKSFNIFLPNSLDGCVVGKTYKLIRTGTNNGVYSLTLRVRSDNGSIDGTSGLQKNIPANSALLITAIAPGVYYTI